MIRSRENAYQIDLTDKALKHMRITLESKYNLEHANLGFTQDEEAKARARKLLIT